MSFKINDPSYMLSVMIFANIICYSINLKSGLNKRPFLYVKCYDFC